MKIKPVGEIFMCKRCARLMGRERFVLQAGFCRGCKNK